jgi:hypothetical protein
MSETVQASPAGAHELYDALSAARRCYIIDLLAEADGPVSVRTLASNIAAIEHDTTPEAASGSEYSNAYNASTQTHLPGLAEVGIVRYNHDRKEVWKGPQFESALLLLRVARVASQTLS